jgi:hypothetical protein
MIPLHTNSGPGRRRIFRRAAAMVLVAVAWMAGAGAAAANDLEAEVKAAMLYNFTRFVEWPASAWKDPRAPMVVGVLGSDPFGQVLEDTLRDKTYGGGRPIVVRRLKSIAEIDGCQVLFVSRSEKKRLAEVLHAPQAAGVLTVSDIEDFTRSGGVIGFQTVDHKVRFGVNLGTASKAGLTISSKLLRLALAESASR